MATNEGTPKPIPGTIGWTDVTLTDAPRIRDFYADVDPAGTVLGLYQAS